MFVLTYILTVDSCEDEQENAGKEAKYNNFGQLEIEAGVRSNKVFKTAVFTADVYIKPSFVRTIVDGGDVHVSNLGKFSTLDDANLGRTELGGHYSLVCLWMGKLHLWQ